ncbi:hypothetical protein PAECIP112173_00800 [Paenibacillus sp. JJ-100]|uniref:hypothetical protein n=1 Tax=Paenibacillus sp. JJ-100 TaxID=2974896 RepID=UPI0022FFC3FE|nr:hypothetical protein [Paenibacillus sp. JJ-100]CAI6035382.1 hypothetical protein PAECIP112173_00800 [Paenibacillus sp. JJ-100]
MGYYFRGIITSIDIIDSFKNSYSNLVIIHLYNGLVTIPLTDELYDEINMNQGKTINKYEYLTDQIGLFCSKNSNLSKTAYVEAEYFGGVGSQNGIVWDSGKVVFEETMSKDAINKALKILGIITIDYKDEFDTVQLGRHRFVDRWVDEEAHL